MRVLIVGLNYVPERTGIAPYAAGLASGLRAKGHSVRVLTAHPHYPAWRIWTGYGEWRRREIVGGVPVVRLLHYVPAVPRSMARVVSEASFGLRALLERWGRPDVVLFVSPPLLSVALTIVRARLRGIPTAVWVQDIYSSGILEIGAGDEGGRAVRALRALERSAISSADRVVVIHPRFVETLARLGVPRSRIGVIRNWTHLEAGEPAAAAAFRARFGWRDDETVVLHAGNMGVKQDLFNVVSAAKQADARGADVRFVLLGGGSQYCALRAAAEGVARIEFIESLPAEEFAVALQAADVLLVNEAVGLSETAVPSKLTSYFSAARPVVAATGADSVTATEIEEARAGVRVAPGEPAALLNAVLAVAADRGLSQQFGENARGYCRSVMSDEVAFSRFETELRAAAQSRRRRRISARVVRWCTRAPKKER